MSRFLVLATRYPRTRVVTQRIILTEAIAFHVHPRLSSRRDLSLLLRPRRSGRKLSWNLFRTAEGPKDLVASDDTFISVSHHHITPSFLILCLPAVATRSPDISHLILSSSNSTSRYHSSKPDTPLPYIYNSAILTTTVTKRTIQVSEHTCLEGVRASSYSTPSMGPDLSA